MQIDANDLLNHEGHRLTVQLRGADDETIVLVCETDDDEVVASETV